MKGYYVYEDIYRETASVSLGVTKKIKNQIGVLAEYYDMQEVQLKAKRNRVLKRLPFGSFLYEWDDALSEIGDADLVYIRKPLIDAGFRNFLLSIKKENPNTQVLLEIPTYPYDREQFQYHKSILAKPFYFKEAVNRRRLKTLVDRIVTYSNDEEIFGIPAIRIQNGVDVSNIPVAGVRENDGSIHLIAVAVLQPHHGYERVLEGLRNYYAEAPDIRVEFQIVGSGETEAELKKLTYQYGLQHAVCFSGVKTGGDLEKLYNNADIAMGSFGVYKCNANYSSALKVREYIAHGLPIVSGCIEDVFQQYPCEYYLGVENKNTPVDIFQIVDFYNRTYGKYGAETVRRSVRIFAEEHVDMKATFEPVIRFLKGTEYERYAP